MLIDAAYSPTMQIGSSNSILSALSQLSSIGATSSGAKVGSPTQQAKNLQAATSSVDDDVADAAPPDRPSGQRGSIVNLLV